MAEQQDMGYTPPAPPDPPFPEPAPKPLGGMGAAPVQQYIIYGTNQPYSGRVVEVGGQLYTTVGGAYEGFSFQVYPAGGQGDNNIKPAPSPLPGPAAPQRLRPSPGPGGTVRPYNFNPFMGVGPGGSDFGDPNQMTPDFSDKFVDDPTVDDTIIIDDPMGRDPLADQDNMGG